MLNTRRLQPGQAEKRHPVQGSLRLLTYLPTLLSLFLLGFAGGASAQSFSDLTHDTNAWSVLHLNKRINDEWTGGIGINNRISDNMSTFRRMRYRGLFFYRPVPEHQWMFAAEKVENYNPRADEVRYMVQHNYALPLRGKLGLGFRTRVEFRNISTVGGTILRTRHMLSFTYPISEDGRTYLVGWEELFLNLGNQPDWPQGTFAQNRVFLGIGHNWGPNIRTEVGYQARYMANDSPQPDALNHTLFMQAFINF